MHAKIPNLMDFWLWISLHTKTLQIRTITAQISLWLSTFFFYQIYLTILYLSCIWPVHRAGLNITRLKTFNLAWYLWPWSFAQVLLANMAFRLWQIVLTIKETQRTIKETQLRSKHDSEENHTLASVSSRRCMSSDRLCSWVTQPREKSKTGKYYTTWKCVNHVFCNWL